MGGRRKEAEAGTGEEGCALWKNEVWPRPGEADGGWERGYAGKAWQGWRMEARQGAAMGVSGQGRVSDSSVTESLHISAESRAASERFRTEAQVLRSLLA